MPNQTPSLNGLRSLLFFRCLITTALVIPLAALTACDRNIEPFQPGEEASKPDLARIFPGPTGAVEPGGSQSGIPARGAVPPSRAESTPQVAGAASAAPIVGRIELSSDLSDGRPAGAVLFVIARAQGVRRGPPLAVLRIADPIFPFEFSIGPENVMIPSMRFEGAISLSARLDADGNAMTRGEGDISSAVEEPLAPGATGVLLVLSQRG